MSNYFLETSAVLTLAIWLQIKYLYYMKKKLNNGPKWLVKSKRTCFYVFVVLFLNYLKINGRHWKIWPAVEMLKLNPQSVCSICSGNAHMGHTPAAVHAVDTTWSAFQYRLWTLHYMDRAGKAEHVGWNGTVTPPPDLSFQFLDFFFFLNEWFFSFCAVWPNFFLKTH